MWSLSPVLKKEKDYAMPKDLAEQRQWCVEWLSCPSPTSFPHQSDDEESINCIGEGEHDAVQGVLGMETTQVSSVLGKRDQEEDDYGWGIVAEM